MIPWEFPKEFGTVFEWNAELRFGVVGIDQQKGVKGTKMERVEMSGI